MKFRIPGLNEFTILEYVSWNNDISTENVSGYNYSIKKNGCFRRGNKKSSLKKRKHEEDLT